MSKTITIDLELRELAGMTPDQLDIMQKHVDEAKKSGYEAGVEAQSDYDGRLSGYIKHAASALITVCILGVVAIVIYVVTAPRPPTPESLPTPVIEGEQWVIDHKDAKDNFIWRRDMPSGVTCWLISVDDDYPTDHSATAYSTGLGCTQTCPGPADE